MKTAAWQRLNQWTYARHIITHPAPHFDPCRKYVLSQNRTGWSWFDFRQAVPLKSSTGPLTANAPVIAKSAFLRSMLLEPMEWPPPSRRGPSPTPQGRASARSPGSCAALPPGLPASAPATRRDCLTGADALAGQMQGRLQAKLSVTPATPATTTSAKEIR